MVIYRTTFRLGTMKIQKNLIFYSKVLLDFIQTFFSYSEQKVHINKISYNHKEQDKNRN